MTNTQREAKFAGLADGAMPPQRRRLMDIRNVASWPDAAQLARAAAD